MNPAAFNDWSASVTWLAVAILWQSTLWAALVAGICRLLRRSAPALRYWCWQIVALKLLVMPWWIVAVPLPGFLAAGATGISPRTAVTTENREQTPGAGMDGLFAPPAEAAVVAAQKTPSLFDLHRQLTWCSWLVVVWLAGIAWQVGRLVVERGRLRRLLSRATPASDPRLLAQMEDVAARLGLSRRPRVVLTGGQAAPFVCGLFRPLLALPRELAAELDAAQLREVLLHELGHLKRRDLWWGWLPALARTIYFFHPAAHWACFRIRLERELACDQLAMTLGGRGAAEYAEVLFQVISRASMPAVLATSSLEGLSTFWRRRMTMLVSTSQSSPHLSRVTRLAIASAALVACLLPTFQHAAVQAQNPSSAKSTDRIFVSASYRIKPEGADEEKTIHNAIVAIDPATGDWQLVVEKGGSPRLSPDRRTLVFNRYEDGTWKCQPDGQYPFKIFGKEGRPAWSPDGKHLVVTKEENLDKDNDNARTTPAWKDETYRIDVDGRNPVKLPIPDTDAVADWSPDGQWFVTTSDRHPPYGRGYQLYLMKTDGTQQRRLTQGGLNVYARFSPDGKKILYLHQTRAEGNCIWTVDVDGENATEIVREVGLTTTQGAFWSPDGKQIAVILFDWRLDENGKKVVRAGSDTTNPRIEIMDADGANRRQLTLKGAKFLAIDSLGDWR
ncbi:MAG TPA: M56 family metallopeptidase [Pirellulales bacterium]|nr:M56 family metallopeptidase [Pirellulales bacterium]